VYKTFTKCLQGPYDTSSGGFGIGSGVGGQGQAPQARSSRR